MIKRWLKTARTFLRKLFHRQPRKSVTVCFLPTDIMKAPTIVGPVKSIRQARRHLKRIGPWPLAPHEVYTDGPEYREACQGRLKRRKAN